MLQRKLRSNGLTPAEDAALRYTELLTMEHTAITDELYDRLKEHFSEPEIVELGSFIALCAGSQRWIHSLRIVPGELDLSGLERSPAAQAQQAASHV